MASPSTIDPLAWAVFGNTRPKCRNSPPSDATRIAAGGTRAPKALRRRAAPLAGSVTTQKNAKRIVRPIISGRTSGARPAAIAAPHGGAERSRERIASKTTARARVADSPASMPLADQRTSQALPAHTSPARKASPVSAVSRRTTRYTKAGLTLVATRLSTLPASNALPVIFAAAPSTSNHSALVNP